MPRAHAWIFQATPLSCNLAAELHATDALSWSVARYGRDLRLGDRVYYWQAGRDAGIYGAGRIVSLSPRGPNRRYDVQTEHERVLFAPMTRADLRGDPQLRDMAVLRQPRGTVFPLTPAQEVALAQRVGTGLLLAVPAARLAGGAVRLSARQDGDSPARVLEAHGRGQDVVVALVEDVPSTSIAADTTPSGTEGHSDADRADTGATGGASRADDMPAAGGAVPVARVVSVRRGRGGGAVLRVQPLGDGARVHLSAPVLAQARGEAVIVSPSGDASGGPVGAPVAPAAQRGAMARVAEPRPPYELATGAGAAADAGRPERRELAPGAADLYGDLVLPPTVAAQLVAAVNAGRHIILLGMPGTGKTSLARHLVAAAARAGLCSGPLLATATADWTTFDTIGGLVPGADGALRFDEGIALRALRQNRWLIIDEINRADIDKAFGPLLTVLSGSPVELPAVSIDGRPIRIEPVAGPAGFESAGGAIYRAGSDWRIIGTMNTLDRAALFSFSLAFARRFAFILVPPPGGEEMLALLRARVRLDEPALAGLRRILEATPRRLGPAILLDVAGYIAARADRAALAEAVCLFVVPQLEGLERSTLLDFAAHLAPVLGADGEAALRAYIAAFYGEE